MITTSPKFAVVQNPTSLHSFMHLIAKIRPKIFLHDCLCDILLPIISKTILGNNSVKFVAQSDVEYHLTLIIWGLILH